MSLYKIKKIYYLRIKHPVTGKIIRKSAGETDYREAQRIEKGVVEGLLKRKDLVVTEKGLFRGIASDLITDYEINKKKGIKDFKYSVKVLNLFFGDMKLINILDEKHFRSTVNNFKKKCQDEGYASASINNFLKVFNRVFSFKKIVLPDKVELLKDAIIRKGIFQYDEFLSLRAALPDYAKCIFSIAFHTGCRKNELLCLKWDMINLDEAVISIPPEISKTKTGRKLYLNNDTLPVMQMQRNWVATHFPNCKFAFPNPEGKQLTAGYLYGDWKTSLAKIGLKKLFHDTRRSALTVMRNKMGLPESVCMKISGHRSRSTFDRYCINDDKDIQQAVRQQAEYFSNLNEEKAKAEQNLSIVLEKV
ncbi:MAG: site-specific integrase [Nitrospirota bacterium]